MAPHPRHEYIATESRLDVKGQVLSRLMVRGLSGTAVLLRRQVARSRLAGKGWRAARTKATEKEKGDKQIPHPLRGFGMTPREWCGASGAWRAAEAARGRSRVVGGERCGVCERTMGRDLFLVSSRTRSQGLRTA